MKNNTRCAYSNMRMSNPTSHGLPEPDAVSVPVVLPLEDCNNLRDAEELAGAFVVDVVGDRVVSPVGMFVGARVGRDVGKRVGIHVGAGDGDRVGGSVGVVVVGRREGALVGDGSGAAEGGVVGASKGRSEGPAVAAEDPDPDPEPPLPDPARLLVVVSLPVLPESPHWLSHDGQVQLQVDADNIVQDKPTDVPLPLPELATSSGSSGGVQPGFVKRTFCTTSNSATRMSKNATTPVIISSV